eukprot:5366411-Alexandrium_andersonii.AAC.1
MGGVVVARVRLCLLRRASSLPCQLVIAGCLHSMVGPHDRAHVGAEHAVRGDRLGFPTLGHVDLPKKAEDDGLLPQASDEVDVEVGAGTLHLLAEGVEA